jgi:hypothetical protein
MLAYSVGATVASAVVPSGAAVMIYGLVSSQDRLAINARSGQNPQALTATDNSPWRSMVPIYRDVT